MSIVFPPTATSNLVQPLIKGAVSLLNPATIQPSSVVAKFNWQNDYGAGIANPNVNVLVNVAMAGGAQPALDQIRSVKIDNLGNSAPVYVTFIDTGDTIVAPPNTAVWENVVTNQMIANVILKGADNTVTNTAVFFTNFHCAELCRCGDFAGGGALESERKYNPGRKYHQSELWRAGAWRYHGRRTGVGCPAQITTSVAIGFAVANGFIYITGMQASMSIVPYDGGGELAAILGIYQLELFRI